MCHVYQAKDERCEADGVWPKTKAGSAARGPCPPNRVGYTSRKCEVSGWGKVLDFCVNEAINKLSDAMEVGLLRYYYSYASLQLNMDNIPTLSNSLIQHDLTSSSWLQPAKHFGWNMLSYSHPIGHF